MNEQEVNLNALETLIEPISPITTQATKPAHTTTKTEIPQDGWSGTQKTETTEKKYECPVCHGNGWELYQESVPEYDEPLEFARICPNCRKLRRSLDETNVPREFHDADMSKFNFSIYTTESNIKKIAESYFRRFKTMQDNHLGLYLWSHAPGSGKTFLACSLGKSIMIKYDISMKFITVPDYLELVGQSYRHEEGEADESRAYRGCSLLIFDDIGSEKSGNWQNQELFRLINRRMDEGKLTIYTSNMPIKDLHVDERTKDRIYNTVVEIHMPEESVRARRRQDKQQKMIKMLLEK